MRSTAFEYDLTGDGQIDEQNVDILVREVLGTEYGSTNLDGNANFKDFVKLPNAFGKSGGREQSDIDGNTPVEMARSPVT